MTTHPIVKEIEEINNEMKIVYDRIYKENKEYGNRNNFEEKNIIRLTLEDCSEYGEYSQLKAKKQGKIEGALSVLKTYARLLAKIDDIWAEMGVEDHNGMLLNRIHTIICNADDELKQLEQWLEMKK